MRYYKLPKAEGIDDLTLAEGDTPRPKRGQVLVRMRAASLNYRDYMVVRGAYARGSITPDLIPLSDGAGEVVEVGADVTRVKVGDRVAGIFMQGWLGGDIEASYGATALGGAIDGVLAEYKLFDQEGLVHLPEHLSYEEGASLPCAAVTAWNALYGGKAPLKSGDSVLLLGTGGVSVLALQFAHAAGARVIQTSSSDDKLERVRALGANETVNYRQHPDWEKEVKRLTDGRGVDYVVEVGGAGTLPHSIASTRVGGTVSLIGVLTQGEIDPALIMRSSVMLRGIYVGSREMFEAMNRAIAFHGIKPVVDLTFDFEDAKEAYRHIESQKHLGKVVIRID